MPTPCRAARLNLAMRLRRLALILLPTKVSIR